MKQVMEINRGSDLIFTGDIKDSLGAAIDLTGFALSAFEPSAEIAPHLTLTITNAAAGQYSGRIEWDDDFPDGMQMQFKVRWAIGETSTTSPTIWVHVL